MKPGNSNALPAGTGQGAIETVEAGNLETNGNALGAIACQCHLNKSGCLVCRRWHRTIIEIEARRAASLRRQALGNLARAGGI